MTRTQWLVDYILGPCRCSEDYTSRGLISPHCSICNDGDAAREVLLLSYQLGHDEADQEYGKSLVDVNRESLDVLTKEMLKGVS